MGYYDQLEKQTASAELMAPQSESLLERYKRQLTDAKQRTEKLERLIRLIEDNPETTEILQLMGRL